MWVLLSVLMFVPTGGTMNLANLQGKWTVGIEMDGLLDFNQYSILWRPFKTVMVGIEGSVTSGRQDEIPQVADIIVVDSIILYVDADDGKKPVAERRRRRRRDGNSDKGWSGSVSIGLYKYFRAHSSFSPFVALSPGFVYYENDGQQREQTYSISIDPGVECFFGLMGKQLSLKFKTSLVSASRTYKENKYSDNVYFYLPTGGYLSTWLCFHF